MNEKTVANQEMRYIPTNRLGYIDHVSRNLHEQGRLAKPVANQRNEVIQISKNVTVEGTVDVYDGVELDTAVVLSGTFSVCGGMRSDFYTKLASLIDEYRI